MGTMVEIIQERLEKVTALARGAHDPAKGEFIGCAMEAAAWISGGPWSDHPDCVCPVISAFMRMWNDALPDDERNELLLPLVPKTIGTRGSRALAERRSLMAADWLVRTHAPEWLRLAGLPEHAETLEGLPEITSMGQIPSIRGTIEAVRDNADRALDTALYAALYLALDTALDTALHAALYAARDAARDAALDAALNAAMYAARNAARDDLQDTKKQLQRSAVELVERMIAADEPEKIAA